MSQQSNLIVDNTSSINKGGDPKSSSTSLLQKAVSASLGSFLVCLLVTPLDVVKTRMQHQSFNKKPVDVTGGFVSKSLFNRVYMNNLSINHLCLNCNTTPFTYNYNGSNAIHVIHDNLAHDLLDTSVPEKGNYNNKAINNNGIKATLDTFKQIRVNEGLFNLWRGLTPSLIHSFPSTIIYYIGYDTLKNKLYNKLSNNNNSKTASIMVPFVSGLLARSISTISISPIELVRTRTQATSANISNVDKNDKNIKTSNRSVTRDIIKQFKKEGPSILFKGAGSTLWRDLSFSGLYWMTYEQTKLKLNHYNEKHNSNGSVNRFSNTFMAGVIAGTIAASITTPFDVIKTRDQTVDSAETYISNNKTAVSCGYCYAKNTKDVRYDPNQSMFKKMYHIAKNERTSALFSGYVPRIVKVAPACAIMISTYEAGKWYFEENNS